MYPNLQRSLQYLLKDTTPFTESRAGPNETALITLRSNGTSCLKKAMWKRTAKKLKKVNCEEREREHSRVRRL